MYIHYFGFRTRPFSITADPQFFYASPRYRDAYVGLWFSVRKGKQLIVLTGSPGTGKTTLLHKTALQLAPKQPILHLPHSPHSLEEWLTAPGLLHNGNSTAGTPAMTFEELLKQSHGTQETGVVFLDEAQDLSAEAFESLRQLLNLRSAHGPLLTLVLAGNESLEEKFAQPEAQDLQQRIDTLIRVRRLHKQEVEQYITYRFNIAGHNHQDIFTPDAIQQLAHYSKGIPRLVNLLCDNALQAAHLAETQTISAALIDEIAQQLLYASSSDHTVSTKTEAPEANAPVTVRTTNESESLSSRYPVVVKHGLDQLAWIAVGILVAWLSVFQTTPGPLSPALTSTPTETPFTKFEGTDLTLASNVVEIPRSVLSATSVAQEPEPPTVSSFEKEQKPQETITTQQPASPTPHFVRVAKQLPAPRTQQQQQAVVPTVVATRELRKTSAQQELAQLNIATTGASLLKATERGETSIVRLLLSAGVSPNIQDKEGWTPLMLAARDNRQDILQTLLDSGAHPDVRNHQGSTALMMAAMHDHAAVIALLLNDGAPVDSQTGQGWTALTYAAWKGHQDVVTMLLRHGANAHKKDKDGWTPLMYASWRNEKRQDQENLQRDIAKALGIDGEPLIIASRGDYQGVAQTLAHSRVDH